MPSFLRRTLRLLRLAGKLGMMAALSLTWQYARHHPVISLRPRGYRLPVHCRRSRSDLFVLYQGLVREESAWSFERPPRLIIDAGANIGLVSVNYARQFPDATIIAIEPDEQNFMMLCRNTAGYPNIRPTRAGLWSRGGWLVISNPQDQSMSLQVRPIHRAKEEAVPAVTVDQIINESGFERAELLKIDIEGAEHEVFQNGIEQWLDRVDGILVELHEEIAPGATAALTAALCNRSHTRRSQGEYQAIRLTAQNDRSTTTPKAPSIQGEIS